MFSVPGLSKSSKSGETVTGKILVFMSKWSETDQTDAKAVTVDRTEHALAPTYRVKFCHNDFQKEKIGENVFQNYKNGTT